METTCGHPRRDISHITPIVGGVSGGAALISVIIRCISIRNANSIHLDDILIVASLVIAVAFAGLEFDLATVGFGRDIWTVPPKNIDRIVQVGAPILS